MRGQQWPAVFQLGLEELDALLFIPVGITPQAQVVGNLAQRITVASGVLAHVQAAQEQAKGHGAAQAVEQRAFGDHTHAAGVQGLVAQLQRRDQVAVVHQHLGAGRLAAGQCRMRPRARCSQAIAQLLEQGAVGFGTVADLLAQRIVGLLHGQLGSQRIDVAQEQVGSHPARQQQDFAGDRCGHVGVAITVTAHPRGEADRRRFQRQAQAGSLQQGLVDLAQVAGDGVPQRMLDYRKAPLGFVHRRRSGAADFFGVPGLGDQPAQALAHLLAFARGQVAVVLGSQLAGDGIVLLDQGAAGHFGGVRSEHQLDVELGQLPGQGIIAVPGLLQARQQLGQHPGLERLGLVGVAAADQLVLLGHVGQVEELVEGPGHGQQVFIGQVRQGRAQLLAGATAVGLGTVTDVLDLLQERLAMLQANGIAKQFTQHMDIFTQTHIDIGHWPSLRRGSGAVHPFFSLYAIPCGSAVFAPRVPTARRRWQAVIGQSKLK